MLRAGAGYSTALNPKVAAAEAVAAALSQAGLARAEGALCFATSAYGAAYPLILRTVAAEARTEQVAGCSSLGVIAGPQEIEGGHALAVLVLGGDGIAARRFFVPSLRGRGPKVASEIAATLRPALGPSNLLCLFADTYNMDPESLLPPLARELPGVVITGGGASEDGSIGETFQFCGDTVSNNAVSGMLIAGDFDIVLASSLAATPIGGGHRVTAARENVIAELDGRPAFEVFAEAAGPLAADLRRALTFVFLAVPLDPAAQKIERGSYLVRNITGASKEHGVIAVAHHPAVGETVGFVLRDGERARQDLKQTLDELRGRIATPPAFGLYFDCVSRGAGLYNIAGHDSAYIRQYLGEIPLAGFFTGFEIGPIGATTGLLQYSGVLALVSERKRA
ncbi:MAG TPA: FIST N-terminal domain-containing protein [Candidatus Binataceae bacterium]|nr:FIST N-terminal domain-containing protein [Candidatus Binataceae bacterium]